MTAGEIISLGAAELARRIRSKQLSPLEVVEAHIERIEAVNPAINALVTPTFDQARDQAHRATDQLAAGSETLPPLFGVPVTVKDALAVAGVRFTAGSTFYQDHVAVDDAEAVWRLRAAGAIILGKTNCPDMSSAGETNNLVFGLTRNPWNLERSAGGSSGGEGALIAAGGSPLGLGSDIAGSIRIPAAFCGVVGLKPTPGRIPTEGHVPAAPVAVSDWNTVGPLARRVEDLALALSVLSDQPISDYRTLSLKKRCVLVPEFLMTSRPSREIAAAVQATADALADAGMQVETGVKLPMLKVAFELAAIMHRDWLPEFRVTLGGGQPVSLWAEAWANLRGKGRVSLTSLPLAANVAVQGPILRLFGAGREGKLDELRKQILEAMGSGGLLLWPVFSTTAPKHGFMWGINNSPVYTSQFNSLGFPAVAVPVGLSNEGLPLGVQVIARPGEDETALAVAAELERVFGDWQMAQAR